jgi:hypothetical protein
MKMALWIVGGLFGAITLWFLISYQRYRSRWFSDAEFRKQEEFERIRERAANYTSPVAREALSKLINVRQK